MRGELAGLKVVEVRIDSSWHFIRGPKVTVEIGLLADHPQLRAAGVGLHPEVRRALLDWLTADESRPAGEPD